jgi:DNA-binding transcriptional LysR family regulator
MVSIPYHSGMELRQLRYLVALAQELSFTKAAVRANVAQPALSRQIRKLEDELGAVLFDRTSRRVQTTAAGQRLVERAIVILDEVDNARAEIRQVTELTSGRLAIGTTQSPGPLDIARLLYEFHMLYPGIELAVREELSVNIADRLRVDELDLGFVSEIPRSARDGLELTQVAAEPLVLALSSSHRLAAQAEVDFHDLKHESFVLFPEGATIRGTFDRLAKAYGIEPHIAFVTTDTDRVRELVALGLGISLLPQSDANRPAYNHATASVRNETLDYNVYIAHRRNRRQSAAAGAMISLVKAFRPWASIPNSPRPPGMS